MKRSLWSIILFILIAFVFTACGRAENFYKNGKKSFIKGDYNKAAECFASAVSINPDQADYYIDYGTALIKLGDYEKAVSVFDRAYMNKDMSIIRKNDKKVLRGKGISYYCLKQYDKAVQEFEKALDIKELPELNTDILLYMAASYQASGQYKEAVDKLTDLLKKNPKNAFIYAKRAECYRLMSDSEKSIADYDSAIKLEPGNYEYYFAKYYTLEETGNDSGAKAVLEQAQKLEQADETDRYYPALILYYQGKYDAALGEFEECLTDYKEAAYYIGEIYRIRKDYANAISYYEKYITDGGTDFANAYNQIAVCFMKTGDYEEALNYIEKGLTLNDMKRDRILRKNEIIAYEYLGKYEKADLKLTEYLKDYPDDSEAIREEVYIGSRLAGSSIAAPD